MKKKPQGVLPPINWVEDPQMEHLLSEHGLEYKVISFTLADVDHEASATNMARPEIDLDNDHVQLLQECFERQAPMKYLVVRQSKKGKVYITGRHRGAGVRNLIVAQRLPADAVLKAYLVTVTDANEHIVLHVLPKLTNIHAAKELTPAQRLLNAVNAVTEQHMSNAEAARTYHLRPESIRAAVKRIQIAEWMEDCGGLGNKTFIEQLPDSVILPLDRIALESVRKLAAKLIIDAGYTGDEADALANDLKAACTSEADQLSIIKSRRTKLE